MFAGVVSITGQPGLGRVVRKGMEGQAVKPGTNSNIKELLVVRRTVQPVTPTGEGFRINVTASIEVGSTGRLLGNPETLTIPEFTSRNIGLAQCPDRIDPRKAAVTCFGAEFHAVTI